MKNFLLLLNRIFLGVNIGLTIVYALNGNMVMTLMSVLCAVLNYTALKQLSRQ